MDLIGSLGERQMQYMSYEKTTHMENHSLVCVRAEPRHLAERRHVCAHVFVCVCVCVCVFVFVCE